jgi:hypothetical protein
MLDIEITPEKSISTEKWQIILGITFEATDHTTADTGPYGGNN